MFLLIDKIINPPAGSFFAGVPPVYVFCGVVGLLALLLHLVLDYFGFREQPGLGHDPVGPQAANLFHDLVGLLYPLAVGATLFGAVGVIGSLRHWEPWVTALAATSAFAGTTALGEGIRRLLGRLAAQERINKLRILVGKSGYVTRTVPGKRQGLGQVAVLHHQHEVEMPAITGGDELAVGARISVVGLAEPFALDVLADREHERMRQIYRGRDKR